MKRMTPEEIEREDFLEEQRVRNSMSLIQTEDEMVDALISVGFSLVDLLDFKNGHSTIDIEAIRRLAESFGYMKATLSADHTGETYAVWMRVDDMKSTRLHERQMSGIRLLEACSCVLEERPCDTCMDIRLCSCGTPLRKDEECLDCVRCTHN